MVSLECLSKKNNEQMQDFCNKKIIELTNLKHLHEIRVNDKAWFCDRNYLNYEIGRCTLEIEYYSYFLYLLQEEHKKIKDVKKFDFSQIEMR